LLFLGKKKKGPPTIKVLTKEKQMPQRRVRVQTQKPRDFVRSTRILDQRKGMSDGFKGERFDRNEFRGMAQRGVYDLA
jgi:hypothetical protein